MEVKEYCSNMKEEIVEWKAKAFDLMRTLDKRFEDSDKKTPNTVKILSDMIEDVEKKLDILETECPADWSTEKAEIEQAIKDMDKIWKESVESSPDDF